MRKTMTTLTLFVASLTIAGIASGQFPGGGGGFGPQDAYSLLRNPQVKKELEITEEQSKAVPGSIDKALAGVLNEKQFARLKQIELQQKGSAAYLDAKVQETLKMSASQKDSIKTIMADQKKELDDLGFKGGQEKRAAIRKAAQEKIDEVLSLDQKAAWKKMLGEPFKLEVGGGFNKKKTTE